MTRRHGTAQFVAALAALSLAGCGTSELFGEYAIPESPEVAAAPYPRLVDVPAAPPVGEYTAAVPDPAEGARTLSDLSTTAAVADVLARDAAGPVVAGDAALAATVRRAGARAEALSDPVADAAEAAADSALAAAARARAETLSAPVISDAEREEMLARARQRR